ncbi:MAG: transporter associated domain-containing protein [Caldilineaceae bacterium]
MVNGAQGFDLASLVREPVFVPETLSLEDMLADFRRRHVQIAVVVDEYGGTAGIVTLKIWPRRSSARSRTSSTRRSSRWWRSRRGSCWWYGDLLLDEITQHYDVDFDDAEAETVGGLIMERLGHAAAPGEEMVYNDVVFRAESIDGWPWARHWSPCRFPRRTRNSIADEPE